MGLTRAQLFAWLEDSGPVVLPLILDAYRAEEEQAWREGDHSPHGAPWHTSFHSSSFPGASLGCGRLAVYTLMDPPGAAPFEPHKRAMFDLGLNLEHDWVRRFRSYGSLLSRDVTGDDEYQTGFEDEEYWLTGGTDAIVLPRGWRKPHFVEIKTTSIEKVLAMRANPLAVPFSHPKYVRQLKTYIGLGHELPYTPTVNLCDESGAIVQPGKECSHCRRHCFFTTVTLLPPDDGTLIYSSREEPLTTASYRIQYDPVHMEKGREQLAAWREDYLADRIPEHPYEGQRKKWTAELCQWCDLKSKVCKPDYEAKVKNLSDSHLIEFARSVHPDYDYASKRATVLFHRGVDEDPARLIGSATHREEASTS